MQRTPEDCQIGATESKVFIVRGAGLHLCLFPLPPPYAPLDLSSSLYATMLTLEPGSLCDVCADEFGIHNLPHCIPCGPFSLSFTSGKFSLTRFYCPPGHVLCLNCCNNILEKTSSRSSPACPFCREQFTRGTVRLIRFDLGSFKGGSNTPRKSPTSPRPPLIEDDFPNDLLLKASAPIFPDPNEARAREARVLESKVARVASKKCSVEEVTALQLSSLLLKAILTNHVAFSDASKAARNAETSLKLKVDELEHEKGRLEVELHK